jgi:hypothetical protein
VRRFVSLAVLLLFTVPFGLSVVGCGHKTAPVQYCNASDSGPIVGQVASISLSPTLAVVGESLNYGQIGQGLSASAKDCKGNAVSVSSFIYSSTSSFGVNQSGGPIFADINPSNGQVCGGTWNRNSGGGIPDYTTCTPPPTPPVSTATAVNLTTPTAATATAGSTTGLVLAAATDSVSGTLSLAVGSGSTPHSIAVAPDTTLAALATQISGDSTFQTAGVSATTVANSRLLTISGPAGVPNTLVTTGTAVIDSTTAGLAFVTATATGGSAGASNPIPVYIHPVVTGVVLGSATPAGTCANDPGTDCCTNTNTNGPVAITAPVYTSQTGCLSQNTTGQLIARVYANGNTNPANNITCQVGHLTYSALNASNIVTIDQNGVATANQPGSAIITATVAQSSTASQAGFFSTCPPASITLTAPGNTMPVNGGIGVSLNNLQPLTTTVLDTKHNPITGLSLEFNSSTPQTIPAASGSVTPIFPGTATITAVCLPSTCNPSPFNQIGLDGNGQPLTSNGITVTATGSSGTVLYMASTQSQYVLPRDFTTTTPSSLLKLPYVPNSMVITQDGTSLYFGSPQGLMSIATATNTVSGANQNVPGTVLSVSPSGTFVVVTDPTRQTISLYSPSSSGIVTGYGGVGTSAQWSPDSQTVYITTTTNTLLTYSAFTNWQTTAATEPYTDAAVLVPSVGAYFAGGTPGGSGFTDGRSYCPSNTSSTPGTTAGSPDVETNTFAPLANENATVVDEIATTTDGRHLLGAHALAAAGGGVTFSDFDLTIPVTSECPYVNASTGPTTVPNNYFQSSPFTQPLTGVTATAINSVVPTTNSALAFVTYTGSGGLLPYYVVPATGQGALNYITLGNGATAASAPVTGVVSSDNLTFYAGTAGLSGSSADNDVHLISISGTAPNETGILSPNLPAFSGSGYAPVNLLAQRPKKSTN